MTERAITPLRQRMIEDMAIRRLAPGTQAFYVSAVARFARHFGRSPDTLGYEDVRAYQLHLVQSGLAVGAVNRTVTALRFFYKVTMGRRDAPDMIPLARRPEKQRVVLTPQEVARLIDAAPGPKYRAALSVAYGAGLRASEVMTRAIVQLRAMPEDERKKTAQRRNAVQTALIAAVCALVASVVQTWTPVRVVEGLLQDLRIAFMAPPADGRVVIAAIDEASIEAMRSRRKQGACLCRSPLDEVFLAKLIDVLDRKGASTIGVDIVADQSPVPAARAVLKNTLAKVHAKIVMLADGDPALQADTKDKVVFASAPFAVVDDYDGVARRHEPIFGGRPSFAAAIAQAAGAPPPAHPFLLRFRSPRHGQRAFPVYPAAAVEALPDDWVRGNIVLIGRMETDPAALHLVEDQHLTPLRLRRAYRGGLDGVEGHAHVVSQIITGDRVRTPGRIGGFVMLFVAAFGGAALGRRPGSLGAATLLAVAALALIVLIAFWAYWRFAFMGPLFQSGLAFALALVVANRTMAVDIEKSRRFLQQAFSHYLAPEVVSEIARSPESFGIAADRRTITVVSTDLEGFSVLTATAAPDKVAAIMNAYFDGMIAVLWRHGAMIDKLVGDGILAVFGAPTPMTDHAGRAVRCARELDAFGEHFRASALERFGVPAGRTRIGIETGDALVGNFGGALRFDYTAYGEVVVRAVRLQSANKGTAGRVLIGAACAAVCGEALKPAGVVRLQGITEAAPAFTL